MQSSSPQHAMVTGECRWDHSTTVEAKRSMASNWDGLLLVHSPLCVLCRPCTHTDLGKRKRAIPVGQYAKLLSPACNGDWHEG
ncbi:unnamed protein product [Musa acuminata var. zebrina]